MTLGFVYFISSDHALLKIGYSADPATRLRELQTATGATLTLLGAIPGDLSTESALHRRFDRFHANREWFRSEPELLREINALIELYPAYTSSNRAQTGTAAAGQADDDADLLRYDGLSLRAYQSRELGRFIRETWPFETARSAASALNEPLQTIRNWLEGVAFPGGFKLLGMQRRFGLEFLARIDPEAHVDVAAALVFLRRRTIEAEIARLSELLNKPDPGAP